MRVFKFSVTYLMWLFAALLIDHYVPTIATSRSPQSPGGWGEIRRLASQATDPVERPAGAAGPVSVASRAARVGPRCAPPRRRRAPFCSINRSACALTRGRGSTRRMASEDARARLREAKVRWTGPAAGPRARPFDAGIRRPRRGQFVEISSQPPRRLRASYFSNSSFRSTPSSKVSTAGNFPAPLR